MTEGEKCFLCGKDGRAVHLERHHLIEGNGRRQLSEKFNLCVMLCPDCHRNGERAAHRNTATALSLHQYAERKWLWENEGTIDEFIQIFGKNYL